MSPAGPTSPANPYDFVDGLPTGSAFVDRPALLEKVTAVWKVPGRPANLSLFGLSKTGRSSLVARALAGIGPERRRDLAVVWLSVGRQPSVYGLFGAMAEQITTAFPDLPELAALAAPVRDTRDLLKLPGAIAEFFGAVGERGRHVLVVMDDFDRAPRVLPELSAFQLLRTLASEPDYPVGLLTISRRPLAAIETDAAGGSRLDQVMGERVHVGLFTAAEAGRMVDRARRAGLDLSAVLPELLAWSGLHPYLLGVLCRRLVEQHRETGRLDVAAAAEAEAGEFRSYFSRLVEELDEDIAGGGDLLRAVADGATVAPAPGEPQGLGGCAAPASGGPASAPAPASGGATTPSGAATATLGHGVGTAPGCDADTVPESRQLRDLTDLGVVVRNGADLRLFSPALTGYVRDPRVLGRPGGARTGGHRCTALVVATEWSSAHGGLSTLNQRLCWALAGQRVRVFCLVPQATSAEVEEAAAQDVTLLVPPPLPGVSAMTALLRRPALPVGVLPDLVIGHSRITGPIALLLAEIYFWQATRLHFVHMAPDEIEWFKPDREEDAVHNADARTKIELGLARAADRTVAVGPRLHDRFLSSLGLRTDREPLRFDPGFDLGDPEPARVPAGSPMTVLITGRVEDWELKGLDIAVRACARVAGWRQLQTGAKPVELLVRGVPEQDVAEQLKRLEEWRGGADLPIVARPFTTDGQSLADDLARASVVVMPSRAEGFGLSGLEALVEGRPVLVSSRSGLGELLRAELDPEAAAACVVPTTGHDTDTDTDTWARAIERVLLHPKDEFARAEKLRQDLAARLTWAGSVEKLLTALER